MKWELLDDEKINEIWDNELIKFSDYNFFQTYKYGEYTKTLGYKPHRWAAFSDNKEIKSMFQGWSRKFLGVTVVLGRGGPVGQINELDETLQETIISSLGRSNLYCHCFPYSFYKSIDSLNMELAKWRKPSHSKISRWSLYLDLTLGIEELKSSLSGNWQRNLKRSNKQLLNVEKWDNPEPDLIYGLYQRMEIYKKIPRQFSGLELQNLINIFSEEIVLFRCLNESGTLIGVRGCIKIGNKGLELFAAVDKEARKRYVSYKLLWELIKYCRMVGIKYYDFNGINVTNNIGVYNFKLGTGAELVEYLGEYDWATSETIRRFMGIARRLR